MAQGFLVGLPQRLFDSNGLIGAGWKIYTYTPTGTFSTLLNTYSNAALTSANTNPIIADASGYFRAFVAEDIILDVRVQNASSVSQFDLLSVEPMMQRASNTFANPTITGDAISGVVASKSVTFAETATGVLHVATIPIPAGADLVDILVSGGVLWGAGAAVLKVGDTADDDGYIINMNLKATDLLPGEVFSAAGSTANWGGRNGAYLNATTGQRGPTSSNFGARYVAGSNIIATITVTTPSVTTGRTYLTVLWATGQTVAPVVS